MNRLGEFFNKAIESGHSAYQYLRTKPAINAAGLLTKNLLIDALSTVKVAAYSIAVSTPTDIKSFANAAKAIVWDAPKIAYYHYQENYKERDKALLDMGDDLLSAGSRCVESISIGVNAAYDGMIPLLSHTKNSIVTHGSEIANDVVNDATLILNSGLELATTLNQTLVPTITAQLTEKMTQAQSVLQASSEYMASAYQAMPSVSNITLLPSFETVKLSNNILITTLSPTKMRDLLGTLLPAG